MTHGGAIETGIFWPGWGGHVVCGLGCDWRQFAGVAS
jgi:hypothetical protein